MFNIHAEPAGTIAFTGRLDTSQAPRAMQALQALEGAVTVDLSRLDYISSAGLGVFIASHNRLKAAGGSLVLVGPSDHIRHILALARLDTVLTIR